MTKYQKKHANMTIKEVAMAEIAQLVTAIAALITSIAVLVKALKK